MNTDKLFDVSDAHLPLDGDHDDCKICLRTEVKLLREALASSIKSSESLASVVAEQAREIAKLREDAESAVIRRMEQCVTGDMAITRDFADGIKFAIDAARKGRG